MSSGLADRIIDQLQARIAELELQVASAYVLTQVMLDSGEVTGLVRAQLQSLQATLKLEGRAQP